MIDRLGTGRISPRPRGGLGGLAALLLGVLLGVTARADPASAGTAEPLRTRCAWVDPSFVSCDVRLTDPADVLAARVSAAGIAAGQTTWEPYPTPRSLTAALLMVDSSGDGRQLHIARAADDLTALLEAAPGHVRFGLASFDSELSLAAPIGESHAAIRDAAGRLTATDRPTELYRDALEAIRILAATPADRRALFLFSDGLAEDRAYFHQDVVSAAQAHGITILGFGYPRSPAQNVALQTLRRLSEDTGGAFFAADASGRIARDGVAEAFRILDSGGSLRADLASALAAGVAGPTKVLVSVQTSRGTAEGKGQVELPRRGPGIAGPGSGAIAAAGSAPASTSGVAAARPAISPTEPPRPRPAQESSGGLLRAALVLGTAAVALAVIAWAWRRRSSPRRSHQDSREAPAGYLHFRDQPEREGFPIAGAAVRIGRQRDNDLVLQDTSVSRHHAEIHRGADGTLTVVDLDSLNGVFVNERQIKSASLSDGDSVEIGDVKLLFSQHSSAPSGSRRGISGGLDKTVIARPDDLLVGPGPS